MVCYRPHNLRYHIRFCQEICRRYRYWKVRDPELTPVKLMSNSRIKTKGIINFCSLLSIGKKTLHDSERLVVKTISSKFNWNLELLKLEPLLHFFNSEGKVSSNIELLKLWKINSEKILVLWLTFFTGISFSRQAFLISRLWISAKILCFVSKM